MKKLIVAAVAMLMANSLFAMKYITHETLDLSTYDWAADTQHQFHYGWKAAGASNTYKLTKNFTIPSNVDQLSVFCGGDHPLVFDLGGWKLNLGKNGLYYVSTTSAAQRSAEYPGDGYITYKNGTINFYDSLAAGYDVGNGYIKLAGTWNSQQVMDMHITLDNMKFISPGTGAAGQVFIGTKGSTVTLDHGSELSLQHQIHVNSPNSTADSIYSTGNTLLVKGGSKVSCKNYFYTVVPSASPTAVLDSDTHMIFEGEGTTLTVGNTVFLSHKIGGNHLVLRDKATATIANGFQFAGGSLAEDGDYCGYNNSLVLDSGAKMTSTSTFSMGSYSADAKGANNCLLFIGDGAELYNKGQFMQSGENNQVIISNGTLRLNSNQYSFYQGYSTGDTKHSVNNNRLVFKGDHPRLCHDENTASVTNRLYIYNNTVVVFELPENGEYKTVPIDFDHFNVNATTKIDFPNIAKVCMGLKEPKDIVLAKCRIGTPYIPYDASHLVTPLPKGCSITTKDTELVLHLEPPAVAEVSGKRYGSYEAAVAAVKATNDVFKVLDDVTATVPCVFNGGVECVLDLSGITSHDYQYMRDLRIDEGAKVHLRQNSSMKIGYSSTTVGAERPVSDCNLYIGNGGQLLLDQGQFMVCGTNNTVTVDDGQLLLDRQRYALYIGHSYPVECPNASTNNNLVIKGRNPKVKAYAEKPEDGLNYSDFSVRYTHVTYVLPEDPAELFVEAPLEGGNSCNVEANCTVSFENLEALQLALDEPIDVPLATKIARSEGDKIAFHALPEPALPAGCSIFTVNEGGYSTAYLHVAIAGAVVEVNGKEYKSYDDAFAALPAGGTVKFIADNDDPVEFGLAKKAVFDFGGKRLGDLRITNGATVSTKDGGFNMGYDSQTPGEQRPAENLSLTIGDGATLALDNQFMCCGTNNTLTLDNGAIIIEHRQNPYAFYYGHAFAENPGVSSNNTIILRGAQPKVWVSDKTEMAQLQVQNTHMIIELDPENLYTEPVFKSQGAAYLSNHCTAEFRNVEEARAAIIAAEGEDFEPVDVPLVESVNSGISFMNEDDYLYRLNGTLPTGCYVWLNTANTKAFLRIGHEDETLFDGGCGSQDDPFQIASVESFAQIGALLEAGVSLDRAFFVQTEDLVLEDWAGLCKNYEGEANADAFAGFHANYDGQGKEIQVTFADGLKYTGVFNTMRSGWIANLNVVVMNDEDTPCKGVAGIVGVVGGSGVVSNCTVSGTIYGTHNCGGIAVKATDNAVIADCVNEADITTSYTKVGGIVAFVQQATGSSPDNVVTFENCSNSGAITGTNENHTGDRGAGGILGWGKMNISMVACANSGKVKWTSDRACGEIVGAYGEVGGLADVYTLAADGCEWENAANNGYGMILDDKSTIVGLDGEGGDPVAMIGDKEYYRLLDAADEVQEGETIVLCATVSLEATIAFVNKTDIILDLNGQYIQASDEIEEFDGTSLLKAQGTTLTIIDSQEGTGALISEEGVLVEAGADATVTIESGSYIGEFLGDDGLVVLPGECTAAFDRDQSDFCESGYVTAQIYLDDGDEMWYVTEGEVGPEEPVEPGDEIEIEAESADEAMDQVKITVPEEVAEAGVGEGEYVKLFTKAAIAVPEKPGYYLVKVVLDPAVEVEIAEEIEVANEAILANPGEAGTVGIATKRGLFYSVEAGATLDGMTEGERKMGNGGEIDLEVPAIDGAKGFYSIRVNATSK